MVKIKIKESILGKAFLIDLYNTLERNLQLDREFQAINHVVEKMYHFNKEQANIWVIHLINKYACQGLVDYKNNYDNSANIKDFLEELVKSFCSHNDYKTVIQLIHDKVQLYQSRFFIWKFIIYSNEFHEYFFQLLEHDMKMSRYDTISRIIQNIIDNQCFIEEGIFDSVDFLAQIIEHEIEKDYIQQKQLNFLYSLIDCVTDDFDKAYLKSYFINFI